MVVISGCVIVKDNKILMVKEAKKKCYGKWSIPAGHVDGAERITDAAIREVYEETGVKVKLTGVLPIIIIDAKDDEPRLCVRFTAEIIEENIKFDTDEILDVQWIDIEKVKNMTNEELRICEVNKKFVYDFENGKIYPIEIFEDTIFKK